MSYRDLKITNKIKFKKFQTQTIFINEDSFHYLICISRLPTTVDIAKDIGFKIHEYKVPAKETDSISKIIKVFKNEKIKFQYTVLKYKIDLYFLEYKLAIECDENNHKNRDSAYEKLRQKQITQKLKCSWIRFNPDADDFDILDVIHDIYNVIKPKI